MTRYVTERTVLAAVMLLVPLALLAVSVGARFADLGGAFSPMFFPAVVLWFWAGVAALGLVREVRAAAPERPLPARRWAQVGAVAAAMGLFVWGVTELGFLLSAIAFTGAVLVILGMRGPVLLLGYAVAMPGAFFVLFHHMLKLPLPTSPFSYLF